MKFCPECDTKLRHIDAAMICPRCEYKEDDTSQVVEEQDADEVSEFNVLKDGEGTQTLPTVEINCPKCDHDQAVWWMLQTRSADEPTTQFYRCMSCSHTWRNYS